MKLIFTLVLTSATALLMGCTTTLSIGDVGPTTQVGDRVCDRDSTTSSRTGGGRSQMSNTEDEVCTWTDNRGRECTTRTVWHTTWTTQKDAKTGKPKTVPNRRSSTSTTCR